MEIREIKNSGNACFSSIEPTVSRQDTDVGVFNINGELDEPVYQGRRGDCTLIAFCEGMQQSEKGREILQNAINTIYDENNSVIGYSVTFEGINETYEISLDELKNTRDYHFKLSDEILETFHNMGYTDEEIESYTTIPSKYSSGDDDMQLIELAVEKCFNESKNKILYDLRISEFDKKNLEDPLSYISESALQYMFIGKKERKNSSSFKDSMSYYYDATKLDDGFFPKEDYQVTDKTGKDITISKGSEWEVLENEDAMTSSGIVRIKNKETGEEYSFNFNEFYKNTISKNTIQKAKQSNDEIINESNESGVGIFCLSENVAEDDEDIYLNDIFGNEQILYSQHSYTIAVDTEDTVKLINPHDTSKILIFNKEDLYDLPTYDFSSYKY